MPTTAEPPAAPSTAPIIQEDTRPVINVSQLPKDSIPSKPPKPGSARARMYEEMQKKFGGESPSTKTANGPSTTRAKAPEASPAKEPVEAETPGAGVTAPPAPPETTAGQEDASTTPAAAPTVAEAEKGKKVSPWKLVDQFKERATKAESRLLEVEKQIIPEEQRKAAEAQLQQLQSENKEMREELRFHQAEKYDPDVIKSKEEYNRAFNRAMKELKSVVITDPTTQQPRAMTVNDMAELAFMDLGPAQQVAKDAFGDLAPYVMDHRNEIRRLWDAQEAIKEDLKKTGAARFQQRADAAQKQAQALSEFVNQTYQKANAEAVSDPKHGHFFKPVEGDTEWNARLEKGFKLVDEAFAKNALDPSLTQEQRAEVIRRHAAVRNRAAAFGPLRHRVETLEKQLKAAQDELKQFKDTTPTTSGRTSEPVKERPRGMAGLFEEIKKIAH